MAFDRVYLEILILDFKNPTGRKHLVIKSQPFIGDYFSNGSNRFRASNGFYLGSSSVPEVDSSMFLYCRGDNHEKDCQVIEIPESYIVDGFIDKLKIAVAEYNAALDVRYDSMAIDVAEEMKPQFDYTYTPIDLPGKRLVRVLL